MIQEYAADIATQMEIKLSRVSLMGGKTVGDADGFILSLEANGHLVSTLVHQAELDGLESGSNSLHLEEKIRTALERLKILTEP
jgi:translation initiation factor 6 (eIF-6)